LLLDVSTSSFQCCSPALPTLSSEEALFLIKSSKSQVTYPNIVVDNATLNTKTGVILHLMESDDPGLGVSSYTVPTVVPVTDSNDTTSSSATGTLHASFKNMSVNGNIFNTRWTSGQNLHVVFEKATVTGEISAAIEAHTNVAAGGTITPDTREQLGEMTATPHAAYSNGVLVSLDSTSKWVISGTSYLTSLTIASGASIGAPTGKSVAMSVNGVSTAIAAGTYDGNVVLTVQ
jgi:hypothetical protein